MAISSAISLSSWWQKFWWDQQPTPGRLNSTLRIVLASVIALVLMLVLQMPYASIGLYFVFLVSRDNFATSLRSAFLSLLTVAAAIVVELAVVTFTDNDPVARLLSVAAVTFVTGLIVAGSSYPILGSSWGLIYCTVIALWETHAPAGVLVKNSLYLPAAFCVSLGSTVLVEYMFGVRDPVETLQEQRRVRYHALANMFALYAEGAPPAQRYEAATRVSRLAVAGQAGMMALYNTIVGRNLDTGKLPIGFRTRLTMLAELMDTAAAFGLQNQTEDSPEFRRRCALIAEQCRELFDDRIQPSEQQALLWNYDTASLLNRVESSIHAIITMPSGPSDTDRKELAALPGNRVRFFIPGALQKQGTIAFGLKVSLCATLCYIIYHAVAWPGISTSVITVIVGALSTSGATKQRLIFRLVGSVIGGLILGLGATSLLFPNMDSITSLVILIAIIAFVSAWIAAGPKFSYIGLQIAFSFYIVAFEGFSAPTQLAPARDRLIGILLALVMMSFVFDQIWPVRTVTVMRETLASVLRNGARLLRAIGMVQRDDLLRETDILRDRVGKDIAALRTLNDTIEFEFGLDREEHGRAGEMIVRTAVTAAALFWNQVTFLHSEGDRDFTSQPNLLRMRQDMAKDMEEMARSVVQKIPVPQDHAETLISPAMLESPRYGEYVRNTIARYEELRDLTARLSLDI